ncbi:hypothetical protein KSP39_PZI020238 [Platanthera zijinensis]|uniref:Uncharacterized protein n=1 Tax=Platanthera zijinensis TaxID=2320716 RepID=A0AAP0FXT3_9ASPA
MASNGGASGVNGFTAFPMEVSPTETNLLSDLRSQLNSMMIRFERSCHKSEQRRAKEVLRIGRQKFCD